MRFESKGIAFISINVFHTNSPYLFWLGLQPASAMRLPLRVRSHLRGHAFLCRFQFGCQRIAEIGYFVHLANFDFSFALKRVRATLSPNRWLLPLTLSESSRSQRLVGSLRGTVHRLLFVSLPKA